MEKTASIKIGINNWGQELYHIELYVILTSLKTKCINSWHYKTYAPKCKCTIYTGQVEMSIVVVVKKIK